MTRLFKTLQLPLSLAMLATLLLVGVQSGARAQALQPADGRAQAPEGEPPARVMHCGWSPAAPQLPLDDGAEYAEATERDPSESEGDDDHTTDEASTPPATAPGELRGSMRHVSHVEKQLPRSQSAVSTGAPRGPPSASR